MTEVRFTRIRLEKDIGDDVNVILNGEILKFGQLVEVKWQNNVVSNHQIHLNYEYRTNSVHDVDKLVIHYKPYIEIIHNDTKIQSALGLNARRI